MLLLSLNSFANTIVSSSIYEIDYGQGDDADHLVLLDNGSVLKVRHDDNVIHEIENKDLRGKRAFEFVIDDERYVKAVKGLNRNMVNAALLRDSSKNQTQYIPTTVASIDILKKYFRESPYNPKESQCFNRAMVWGYEWWKNHSLRSMKMFIFFTREYIRRYNFEWWFHVAPYAHVKENGKVVERMMDIKYSNRPLPVKSWTDIFMRNKANCNVITKYSDYADFPYSGECYLYRENMYYYQPADLQMKEAWGYRKDKYLENEVRASYKEAFDIDI